MSNMCHTTKICKSCGSWRRRWFPMLNAEGEVRPAASRSTRRGGAGVLTQAVGYSAAVMLALVVVACVAIAHLVYLVIEQRLNRAAVKLLSWRHWPAFVRQ